MARALGFFNLDLSFRASKTWRVGPVDPLETEPEGSVKILLFCHEHLQNKIRVVHMNYFRPKKVRAQSYDFD